MLFIKIVRLLASVCFLHDRFLVHSSFMCLFPTFSRLRSIGISARVRYALHIS